MSDMRQKLNEHILYL